MALDIVNTNAQGKLQADAPRASLSNEQHAELMRLAAGDPGPMVARLRDYYADAVFHTEELESLALELTNLLSRGDRSLAASFKGVFATLDYACDHKNNLMFVAD